MPANVSWKELYRTELFQITEEGYQLQGMDSVDLGGARLPIPETVMADSGLNSDEEQFYRLAYAELLKKKAEAPFHSEYTEPNDFDEILRLASREPTLKPIDEAAYRDRVRGAWFARCAAVILGKPLEMGFDRMQVKEYLESVDAYPLADWVPARSEKLGIVLREDCIPSTRGHVAYVQSDDDIHYTICSLLLMERHGERFTLWDAAQNLLDNISYHWVWTADRMLYYNLTNIDMAEDIDAQLTRFGTQMNPWRESMCPQLKADFWGYITPGNLKRGARMIHRLSSLSATKNGLYGGLFVQGCTSAAMTEGATVKTIIEGGLSNIPEKCRLSEAISDVIRWHGMGRGWVWACDQIYEKYGRWYFAGAMNNIAFIVLSLLEGDLDFERTIATAVMCGTDTDCNSANAGSIVGAAIGYDRLPKKWIDPLNDKVKSCVAGFGEGTITDLVERTIRLKL